MNKKIIIACKNIINMSGFEAELNRSVICANVFLCCANKDEEEKNHITYTKQNVFFFCFK